MFRRFLMKMLETQYNFDAGGPEKHIIIFLQRLTIIFYKFQISLKIFLIYNTCEIIYRDAMSIMQDIKIIVNELEQERQMPPIAIELMDNELSTLYSQTKHAHVRNMFY